MAFYQFMKSTDPVVVAAVRARQTHINDWHRQAGEWAESFGGSGAAVSTVWGMMLVAGVIAVDVPSPGRWRKPRPAPAGSPEGAGTFSPFYGSDAARVMDSMRSGTLPVPGLPASLDAPGPSDSRYVLTPQLVVANDVAYMGLSMAPSRDQDSVDAGGNWVECLSSEFEAAQASRKAEVSVLSAA